LLQLPQQPSHFVESQAAHFAESQHSHLVESQTASSAASLHLQLLQQVQDEIAAIITAAARTKIIFFIVLWF